MGEQKAVLGKGSRKEEQTKHEKKDVNKKTEQLQDQTLAEEGISKRELLFGVFWGWFSALTSRHWAHKKLKGGNEKNRWNGTRRSGRRGNRG